MSAAVNTANGPQPAGTGQPAHPAPATASAAPLDGVGATLDLRDIHLPAAPGFWPPAPGWWLLASLLLGALVLAGRAGLRRWLRARRRQAILAELDRLETEAQTAPALAAGVSALLKRVALSRCARAEVAALTGAAWLAFLDRTGGAGRFRDGPGAELAQAPYAPSDRAIDRAGLMAAARDWVRKNS
jgi:hypothetical protein